MLGMKINFITKLLFTLSIFFFQYVNVIYTDFVPELGQGNLYSDNSNLKDNFNSADHFSDPYNPVFSQYTNNVVSTHSCLCLDTLLLENNVLEFLEQLIHLIKEKGPLSKIVSDFIKTKLDELNHVSNIENRNGEPNFKLSPVLENLSGHASSFNDQGNSLPNGKSISTPYGSSSAISQEFDKTSKVLSVKVTGKDNLNVIGKKSSDNTLSITLTGLDNFSVLPSQCPTVTLPSIVTDQSVMYGPNVNEPKLMSYITADSSHEENTANMLLNEKHESVFINDNYNLPKLNDLPEINSISAESLNKLSVDVVGNSILSVSGLVAENNDDKLSLTVNGINKFIVIPSSNLISPFDQNSFKDSSSGLCNEPLINKLQDNQLSPSDNCPDRIFSVKITGCDDLIITGTKLHDHTLSLLLTGVYDFNVVSVLPTSAPKLISNELKSDLLLSNDYSKALNSFKNPSLRSSPVNSIDQEGLHEISIEVTGKDLLNVLGLQHSHEDKSSVFISGIKSFNVITLPNLNEPYNSTNIDDNLLPLYSGIHSQQHKSSQLYQDYDEHINQPSDRYSPGNSLSVQATGDDKLNFLGSSLVDDDKLLSLSLTDVENFCILPYVSPSSQLRSSTLSTPLNENDNSSNKFLDKRLNFENENYKSLHKNDKLRSLVANLLRKYVKQFPLNKVSVKVIGSDSLSVAKSRDKDNHKLSLSITGIDDFYVERPIKLNNIADVVNEITHNRYENSLNQEYPSSATLFPHKPSDNFHTYHPNIPQTDILGRKMHGGPFTSFSELPVNNQPYTKQSIDNVTPLGQPAINLKPNINIRQINILSIEVIGDDFLNVLGSQTVDDKLSLSISNIDLFKIKPTTIISTDGVQSKQHVNSGLTVYENDISSEVSGNINEAIPHQNPNEQPLIKATKKHVEKTYKIVTTRKTTTTVTEKTEKLSLLVTNVEKFGILSPEFHNEFDKNLPSNMLHKPPNFDEIPSINEDQTSSFPNTTHGPQNEDLKESNDKKFSVEFIGVNNLNICGSEVDISKITVSIGKVDKFEIKPTGLQVPTHASKLAEESTSQVEKHLLTNHLDKPYEMGNLDKPNEISNIAKPYEINKQVESDRLDKSNEIGNLNRYHETIHQSKTETFTSELNNSKQDYQMGKDKIIDTKTDSKLDNKSKTDVLESEKESSGSFKITTVETITISRSVIDHKISLTIFGIDGSEVVNKADTLTQSQDDHIKREKSDDSLKTDNSIKTEKAKVSEQFNSDMVATGQITDYNKITQTDVLNANQFMSADYQPQQNLLYSDINYPQNSVIQGHEAVTSHAQDQSSILYKTDTTTSTITSANHQWQAFNGISTNYNDLHNEKADKDYFTAINDMSSEIAEKRKKEQDMIYSDKGNFDKDMNPYLGNDINYSATVTDNYNYLNKLSMSYNTQNHEFIDDIKHTYLSPVMPSDSEKDSVNVFDAQRIIDEETMNPNSVDITMSDGMTPSLDLNDDTNSIYTTKTTTKTVTTTTRTTTTTIFTAFTVIGLSNLNMDGNVLNGDNGISFDIAGEDTKAAFKVDENNSDKVILEVTGIDELGVSVPENPTNSNSPGIAISGITNVDLGDILPPPPEPIPQETLPIISDQPVAVEVLPNENDNKTEDTDDGITLVVTETKVHRKKKHKRKSKGKSKSDDNDDNDEDDKSDTVKSILAYLETLQNENDDDDNNGLPKNNGDKEKKSKDSEIDIKTLTTTVKNQKIELEEPKIEVLKNKPKTPALLQPKLEVPKPEIPKDKPKPPPTVQPKLVVPKPEIPKDKPKPPATVQKLPVAQQKPTTLPRGGVFNPPPFTAFRPPGFPGNRQPVPPRGFPIKQ